MSLSSVPDPAHRFVVCDVQKMERVLVNVIGNAVKFTPHGGSVTVDVAEDAEQPGFALIRVRDTGIGIPKDALGRVTERYFTVGEQPSGAGLGLAITKELVELHGGHLKIESPPPGHSAGTLVSIGLRQVPSLRVAVLDPDRKSRARLAEILSAKGYAVTEIGDPAAMGEAVAAAAPAVAVVKLGLEMGGEADWVASRGAGASANRPPVVCVSEAALGPDDVKRLRRGAARIVSAPYQPSDVLDAVENVCPAESDPQSR